MKKISNSKAKQEIKEFFKDLDNKTQKEVKKIKKLAMRHKIPLKDLRKKFCKKCFSVYKNPKIRIRNKTKIVTCKNCGYVARWKV
jgi:RNase P subunit RPR2